MPPSRKRRAQPANDEAEASEAESEPQTHRRRQDDDADFGGTALETNQSDTNQMVKNMVRYALACEYSRTPIRRTDINAKVLGTQAREFKMVFANAQTQLRATFGMEMTELPLREKVTLAQRRAAQKSQSTQKSSGAWILTSVLPDRFRTAEILPPPQVPTMEMESQYTGLYSFVVSVILLSGGQLPDGRLERFLQRANIEETAAANSYSIMSGGDKTEKLLKRMEKDGYIIKVKDNSSGEEVVEWVVGPRGKTEIGEQGVKGLVKSVYGEGEDAVELDRRLDRSLGVNERRPQQEQATQSTQRKGRRRRPDALDDEGDDSESSDDD